LKYMLKKAVRGLIPDEILDRKKQGFDVPVHEWCLGGLGDRVNRELDHFCRETDYIDRRAVARMAEQKQGPQLCYLLNLALWWKHFIAGESIDNDSGLHLPHSTPESELVAGR